MRKVAIVVTARPSFARIRTVLDALMTMRDVNARVIFAASSLLHHYGQVELDCPYPIAHRVYSTLEGHTPETSATETGLLAMQLSALFAHERPDCVVTIADRHETLATAVAASYQNITLAHLQGGERTGNIDDKVRNAVSSLADWHFVANEIACERLGAMEVPGIIYVFGCPSIDLAARAVPLREYEDVVVVLQHAVTNETDQVRSQIDETLAALQGIPGPIVWFWPGQDAGADAASKRLREVEHEHGRIVFRRHLPANAFLSALRSARVLVGNSSVGIRECAYLGTPVVNIGTRQSGRLCAENVCHVPHVAQEIARAIRYQLDHGRYDQSTLYGDGTAGPRIAEVLAHPDPD